MDKTQRDRARMANLSSEINFQSGIKLSPDIQPPKNIGTNGSCKTSAVVPQEQLRPLL